MKKPEGTRAAGQGRGKWIGSPPSGRRGGGSRSVQWIQGGKKRAPKAPRGHGKTSKDRVVRAQVKQPKPHVSAYGPEAIFKDKTLWKTIEDLDNGAKLATLIDRAPSLGEEGLALEQFKERYKLEQNPVTGDEPFIAGVLDMAGVNEVEEGDEESS